MSLQTIRCVGYAQVLLAALMLGQVPLWAQGSGVLTIPRVERPPKLEDFLNGDPPPAAARVTDFRQREPGDGVPASAATTAYVSYDQANLYVVFVCKDDPAKVRDSLARREEITVDDGVAVYLDTFHDRKRAYLFQVNPRGVQLDGVLTEGQEEDFSFDTVWQSEGRLTHQGYVVRIAIPFRSLRFPRGATQSWGIGLGRFIRRHNEESYWPHLTKRVAGFVPQFATLGGVRDISPGRNLRFIPYGAFTAARFLDTDLPAFQRVDDLRMGLDAKAVLRDALTVDATVNPDFSQVESDEPQVTINERFEVFFPEKRPFFIENAGFFQTPVNLFFSRRIADPGVGLRLTGKAGRWALGAIAMDDREAGEETGGGRAGIGVLRVQRELGGESSVGVIVSDSERGPGWNRVASADARLKLGKTWIFSGQAMATETRDEGGIRTSGTGWLAELNRDGRKLDFLARYTDLGPSFETQLGFVPRVGFRQVEQELEYNWRPGGVVASFGPKLTTLFNWDRTGRLQDRSLEASFELKLVGETKLELARSETFERFDELPFDTHATGVSVESQWLKWLAVSAGVQLGTAVNHKPAKGLAPYLADAAEAELTLAFRPTPRLRLDHTFLYERLTTLPGRPPLGGSAGRIFTNRILREKLNYQFTRELSFRAIVDYETVDRDPTLSRVEPERRWAVDLLLTYLLHPGTAFHLGYRDGYENLALLPGSPPTLSRTDGPTISTGRQVFLKVSYLFQF